MRSSSVHDGAVGAGARLALEASLLVTVFLAAWQIAELHVQRNQVYQPSSIVAIAAHQAETPFQYRLLVPTIVHWLHSSVSVHRALGTRVQTAEWIGVLSLIGSYYALRSVLATIVGRGAAALCALGLFYFLPFQYVLPQRWGYWYPSDLPGVLFIALGIVLIRRRAWVPYYAVFALGTLNRETICFLTLLQLFVHWGVLPKRELALHILAQAAIYAGIKYALFFAFKENPGPGIYYPDVWRMNLDALQKPGTAMLMASNFGFLWLPLVAGWSLIRDSFARRALLVVPIYVAAACYGSQFDEIRLYGEMIPVVLIGVVALGASFAKDRAAVATR